MGIARSSATSLAVAALVIGVTAVGCSKKEQSSAESTTSATSAAATSSEESAVEETSTSAAETIDYGSLLLPAADMGADTKTGGVVLNPAGMPGASQAYESPDGKSQIIDSILVFPDVATADEAFKNTKLGDVTTGKPEPVEVGDQGVLAIGTTPDGQRSMTVALFSQGRALVELRFEGELNDPVPPDIATYVAQRQAELVADGLPEE